VARGLRGGDDPADVPAAAVRNRGDHGVRARFEPGHRYDGRSVRQGGCAARIAPERAAVSAGHAAHVRAGGTGGRGHAGAFGQFRDDAVWRAADLRRCRRWRSDGAGGAAGRHIEIETIIAVPTCEYLHTRPNMASRETAVVPLLDGIVEYAPRLWECQSDYAFALLQPPAMADVDDLMLVMVYRPLGA